MKNNFECIECGKFDPDGKLVKSLVGIHYWVCKKHDPDKPRTKRDWTLWFVQIGLWGMAVILSYPYWIGIFK